MIELEKIFPKEKLTIITSQGDFVVSEDDFASMSPIYLSIFYHQSCSKQIQYPRLVRPQTYLFLKEYFINSENLNYDNTSDGNQKHRKIGRLKSAQLKEIYIFLSQWDIDEKLQIYILSKIQKRDGIKEIINTYNSFVLDNINVGIIEKNIFYQNIKLIKKYIYLLIKNNSIISRVKQIECIYKMILNNHQSLAKNTKFKLFCALSKIFGRDVLVIFKDFINFKELPKENIIELFDILSNRKDNQENQESKREKKSEGYSFPIFDEIIDPVSKIIKQEIIINLRLTKEKEILHRCFVDLKIDEHSSDIELFYFHKFFLENRMKYFRYLTTIERELSKQNDEIEQENKIGENKQYKRMKKVKIEYSIEMMKRGYDLRIPEILLKRIEEEKSNQIAFQISQELLQSSPISTLSLFYVSLNIYDQGNKKRFSDLIELIFQKEKVTDNLYIYGLILMMKNDQKLKKKKQCQIFIKKYQNSEINIDQIKIPRSIKTIRRFAFSKCSSLKEVELEEGIRQIEKSAFSNCSSLERIRIPKSIETIGRYAFSCCSSLKEIKLEEGIKQIEKSAFSNCSSLERINIPKSIETIECSAFSGCLSLKEIQIKGENIQIWKGIIFASKKEIDIFDPLTKYEISGILSWQQLINIDYKKDISKIKNYLIEGCCSLERIKIPKSIETIECSAFSECSSLKEVELEEGIKRIENLTFSNCSSLEKINIPKSIETIGRYAFSECSSLDRISIPKSIETIEYSAFSGCSSLKEVELEEGIKQIEFLAFSNCSSLERIRIPKSIEMIGRYAFSGCSSLKEVELNEGIKQIEESAFSNCSSLERINIPKSIETIGGYSFSGCSSLKEVELNEGIKQIEESAFSNCSSLERINIPKSIETIGGYAFSGCSSLKEVELNEGIKQIEESAFSKCSSLGRVKYPKSIKII